MATHKGSRMDQPLKHALIHTGHLLHPSQTLTNLHLHKTQHYELQQDAHRTQNTQPTKQKDHFKLHAPQFRQKKHIPPHPLQNLTIHKHTQRLKKQNHIQQHEIHKTSS